MKLVWQLQNMHKYAKMADLKTKCLMLQLEVYNLYINLYRMCKVEGAAVLHYKNIPAGCLQSLLDVFLPGTRGG